MEQIGRAAWRSLAAIKRARQEWMAKDPEAEAPGQVECGRSGAETETGVLRLDVGRIANLGTGDARIEEPEARSLNGQVTAAGGTGAAGNG